MTTQTTITPPVTYTAAERRTLRALRERYRQQGLDLFGPGELERLRFLRWLYHSRRLVP